MADLESDLRRIAAENALKDQREAEDTARQHAAELGQQARKLADLLANPLYKWFAETHLEPLVKTEHDCALDVSRTKEERDASAQRHDMAKTMAQLLPKLAEEAAAQAQAAFAKIAK